ncbi:MAG: lysophospholipid acyltransferase family protein [Chitinophagales bacterium]|nr:lysophospholipid acyltransferase family protein [Chitinophagales bacterium]
MYRPTHAIAYLCCIGLSRLPLSVLYAFSFIIFFIIYYIFQYRRSVVHDNLRRCFPELSEQQRKHIAKKYYQHLADLVVEILKALTMRHDEVKRRCRFSHEAATLFEQFSRQKRHCLVLMGHLGNWEWACLSMCMHFPYRLQPVYLPLRSAFFDGLLLRLRRRFGGEPVSADRAVRVLLAEPEVLTCSVLIADQSPQPQQATWINFLNRPTPFFASGFRLAARLRRPIIYAVVRQQSRGNYLIDAQLLSEDSLNETELLQRFARCLEADVRRSPSQWLWSHRRWKHSYLFPAVDSAQ